MAKRTKTVPDEPSSVPDWDQLPESPNCVTIFGAGIAGLTAAHELVERGFHVQVWEKASDERHPDRGCDVGGLARTQWGAVTWPEERRVDVLKDPNDKRDWASRRTTSVTFVPERFYLRFAAGRFERDDPWAERRLTCRGTRGRHRGKRSLGTEACRARVSRCVGGDGREY